MNHIAHVAPTTQTETIGPFSAGIWNMKYRFKRQDGEPIDLSVEDTFRRVARAIAQAEAEPARWEKAFFDVMRDFRFLPGGRILAGAGTDRNVTLFNCFVMGSVPDDMAGIFEHLKEAALTMQQGGGIGYDFSTLRPKGALVRGVGADASGPLSFMDVWDAMCRTIMSAGSRRGAMMGTMRCDHPDIEAFIEAKRESGRLRMFNLSVLVTDPFMQAVKEDAPWDLVFDGKVYKTLPARALWDKIMHATYAYAEPGVIFIDRVNQMNNLWYCEDIHATNPCGEAPLPPYGVCLLGSVNLARLVRHPFSGDARLDLEGLAAVTRTAVRMLDNVIDVSNFPLPQQKEEAFSKRRMGLGFTGLADALAMCGARYGSDEAVALVDEWLGTMRREAYLASADLAKEKGSFPLFDRDQFLAGDTAKTLDADVRDAIAKHGLRNSHLLSIAPTGTMSLFADNVSSGLEPIFSLSYTRKVMQPDGTHKEEEVVDYAVRMFRAMHGDAPLPAAFVTTQELSPRDHVVMQATVQKYIDQSISKTINVPEDISFKDFKDVYLLAYEMGCKGCTTYRPNEITGSVLSTGKSVKVMKAADVPAHLRQANEILRGSAAGSERLVRRPDGDFDVHPLKNDEVIFAGNGHDGQPDPRPGELPGATYKLTWPESDHAIYITINDIIQDGYRRPFEIFINSKNMEHYSWTVALTRMISAVFRRGGDVSFVVEELKAVFDPRGGHWMSGNGGAEYVPSLLAAIGRVIEGHLAKLEQLNNLGAAAVTADLPTLPAKPAAEASPRTGGGPSIGRQCPKCAQPTVHKSSGCDTCANCGWSKCG